MEGSELGDENGAVMRALLEMDRAIWRISYSFVRRREDVDDLAQTIRLRVLQTAKKFKGQSDPRTWIYRIAMNAGIDYSRSKRRERSVPLDDRMEAQAESAGIEFRTDIGAALERLSPRQRQVLVLRELEGLTYAGIAETLGISIGSVESNLFDARKRVASILKGYGHGGGVR